MATRSAASSASRPTSPDAPVLRIHPPHPCLRPGLKNAECISFSRGNNPPEVYPIEKASCRPKTLATQLPARQFPTGSLNRAAGRSMLQPRPAKVARRLYRRDKGHHRAPTGPHRRCKPTGAAFPPPQPQTAILLGVATATAQRALCFPCRKKYGNCSASQGLTTGPLSTKVAGLASQSRPTQQVPGMATKLAALASTGILLDSRFIDPVSLEIVMSMQSGLIIPG